MIAANYLELSTRRVRLRPIALPVEHGGWSLLFEPIILGLILAPSLVGLCISIGAIGAFLARHPFKVATIDRRRNRRTLRTALAERFAILYGVIGVLGLAFAIAIGGTAMLLPLLIAAPVTIVQLFNDAMGRSRALIAELAGSIATPALATAIALGSGWSYPTAFGLWAILAARNVPTILYLRARLKLLHGKPASPGVVIVVHVLAAFMVFGLALVGSAPFLSVIAVLTLLLRALTGFSKSDQHVTAKRLGLREVGFGAMTVFAVVLGHVARW